jgi:beta-ketoacyl-acyl-carrier-protein synthase II
MNTNARPRVVITGLGVISVLGPTVDEFWNGLLAGKSGIRKITQFDASSFPCQIAGEIPEFNPEDYMDRRDARRVSKNAQIGLAAAKNAQKDAGLPELMRNPERAGVVFGTAIGGLDKFDEGINQLREKGAGRLNPFSVPAGIPNLACFLISREFQCLGPSSTVSTACATGTQAVGEGAEFIRRGIADIVFAGGVEALIKDFAIGGFGAMRALPTNFNDAPEKASRPFDAHREGFLFSEGAACIVLESLDHALSRGARIYAELIGHASSADGYDVAAPDPEGKGAIRCMNWALRDAGISPEMVQYINAHGSSTPLNDTTETMAIKNVFGDHAYKLAISSTKSMLGHAMGASGTLEAIACAKTIETGMIPPTINYEYPDPTCDLDYVPNTARKADVEVTLSNSFGLGGQNACVVLRKFNGA